MAVHRLHLEALVRGPPSTTVCPVSFQPRSNVSDDTFEVRVEDQPDPDHVSQLVAGLAAFNAASAGAEDRQPLGVFLREGGRIVGGADGHTHWQWLYVSHLWIDNALRGHGLGRQVMLAIETEGRRRGCRAAWLDTFSFQAPGFYQAIGYRQFGELPDFPPDHARHFFWKPLGPTTA